jgi:AraC-like DNA-binding protein
MSQGLASVALLHAAVHAARSAGLNVGRILREAGIPSQTMSDADARVPEETANALWDAVARASGDPDFGLHAAERMEVGPLGLIEYLGRTSATLGEALHQVVRYVAILADPPEVSLSIGADVAHFVVHRDSLPRPLAEFAMALLTIRVRQIAGSDLDPLAVEFVHPAPAGTAEHARIFRAPVRFGQPRTAMLLPRRVLDRPLLTAEPGLSRILEHHARDLLARVRSHGSLVGRAYQAVAESLRGGPATLDDVARRVGMSRRTLQRRLREAGTSHQALLEEVRRRLALFYVGEQALPPGEVAYRLGFSDPTAFHHAFKRWTGTTPAAYAREGRPASLKPLVGRRGRHEPGG